PPARVGARGRTDPGLRQRRLCGGGGGGAARAHRAGRDRHRRWWAARHRVARGRACRDDRAVGAELRGHVRQRAPRRVVMPAEIITFGCRLNAFESEAIRRFAGASDAVVVNTCAVTAEAERQARQAIRRARREHPGRKIVVTGCAATLAPEKYAPLADLVLDNEA